jgi:hypothetical protein
LEETLQELDNTAQEIGLTINHNKTKYTKVRRHAINVRR